MKQQRESDRLQALEEALQQVELYRALAAAAELKDVLALLARQIRSRALFDGFLVLLPEDDSLVCRHIDLPGEFKGVESAYLELRVALDSDSEEARIQHSAEPIRVGEAEIARYSSELRQRFERWRMREFVLVPLRSGEDMIGVLAGFRQTGPVDPCGLRWLERQLPPFADRIGHTRSLSELGRRQLEVAEAERGHRRLLDLVGQIADLTDTDQIYEVITREFLAWLPFELTGVVMREGELLNVKRLQYVEAARAAGQACDDYYREVGYALDGADGATARCFLSNRRMLFPDAAAVRHLPMSDKDRRALELMRTPRTFLFIPIRHHDVPVGVLWLISVTRTVELAESQLLLVEALCSIVGTAIANAQLYTTIERQKGEIEAALQELRETQARLARAEEERMFALIHAKEAAEASSAAKSFFVANTSHEIRTPLTAIIGFAESLEEHSGHPGVREPAQIILRNGRHLLGLIDDILDFSKIEAGRVELERVSFSPLDLVREVQSTVGVLARDKGLAFQVECRSALPEHVVGDPERLRQVLLNLCNNAVKFTEEGRVEVLLECDAADELLRFTVVDTGIGIAPDLVDRVFEPFTQLDASTSRRYGGTGLGMAIARDLVELMGGRVAVQSVLGRGSSFCIEIPTGPLSGAVWTDGSSCGAADRSPGSVVAPELDGLVLIAEDGQDNQRLLRLLVERSGARVRVAENGEQAVERALVQDYDLVLMDIQMPLLNGVEALHLLRCAGFSGPVVALTANVMSEDIEAYLAAGFDAHLAKPIDRRAFYDTLTRYLPRRAERPTPARLLRTIDMQDLKRSFDQSLPGHLEGMQRAFGAADWKSIAAEAHKVRGGAATFGRPEVGALATTLEWLARRVQEGRDPELLRQAVARFGELVRG